MSTHNTREWEERFDERFIPNDGYIPTYIENGNDLKEFIHQELQKARHDWLQEEIVKLNVMEIPFKVSENMELRDAYNKPIRIIINRYLSELDQDNK
jgi:hypothetical protein